MDEILSSIKRIIAEDRIGASRRSGDGGADDVLELTNEIVAPIVARKAGPASHEQSKPRSEAQSAQGIFGDRRTANEAARAHDQAAGSAGSETSDDRLIDDHKLDTMRESLSALVAMERANAPPPAAPGGSTSLEELTRDLMRPMLKEWLDTNLPPLVERLVAEEIRRISVR